MASRNLEKFLVGYFSTIGFYFLFGVSFKFIIAFLISPSSGPGYIAIMGTASTVLSRLVPLLYLLFLYNLWNNSKLVIAVGVAVAVSLFPFGVLFAFTFPIWIVFGVLCLVYGYITGLMKGASTVSVQNLNLAQTDKPKSSLRRKILFLAGSALVLAALFYFAIYGLRFPPCVYTNEITTTPPELVGTTVVLEKDQYIGRGLEKGQCGPLLRGIDNHIIDSEPINNLTIGRKYFESRGLTVGILSKGKRFRLERIVAQTKHGLSTIDSGPGPIYYLILSDDEGVLYEIATTFLGYDSAESFLAIYKSDVRIVELTNRYFYNFYKQ